MFLKIILCAITLFAAMVNCEMTTTETYVHSATLRTGNIKLYWNFNATHIVFEVHGQTTGWIGLGFSPNGAMSGSDIYIGWIKNGEIKITDRHGVGNTFPPLDPQQDIDVLGGAECDGWTMFKFSRQLAACEADYDREISQNTQRLIFAWSGEDPLGEDIKPSDYHATQRGVESMYFLQTGGTPSGLPEGPTYKTMDIRADRFEVPAVQTYYNCRIMKFPKLDKKYHIVKYEPIIQEGNEMHVHHLDIYRCGDVMEDPSELDKDVKCFIPNMQHFGTCTTFISSWAVGGEAVYYPEDAGYSIGDEGDAVYIYMQIHYDNPTRKSGIIDSSGIRFTYTDSLRKYDVGIVLMGVIFNAAEHFIPPETESFLSVGHCTSDCWESRMEASSVEDISVFGITLHSHLAGKSMKLRLIRDGVELPPPAYDEHYDFNYQKTRYLVPQLTLKPKDNLQVECIYNTRDRKNVTEGGLGTQEEMCSAFLIYYPKIDLGQCHSSVRRKDSLQFFGLDGDIELITDSDPMRIGSWRLPETEGSKTMLEYLNEYNWTSETVKAFETFYNSRPHYENCLPLKHTEMEVFSFNVTDITTPYVESRRCCDKPSHPLLQSMEFSKCSGSSDSRPRQDVFLIMSTLLLMAQSHQCV